MKAVICGTGSAVPTKVLDNDDLSQIVDTSDEWIRERTAATAILQLPHPRGAKIHAIALPILERILASSCSASSIVKDPSIHPKLIRNHRIIVERRMMVPAFLMKDHPRSHILLNTLLTVGQ